MVELDQKNRLLKKLYLDSRCQSSDLAEILGVTRQTASKFRQKLWDSHIIESPALIINPHALNLQYFFMEIATNPSEPELLNKILSFAEVSAIDGILGEYSLIVKFEAPTKKHFAAILERIDDGMAQSLFHSYRIIEAIDVFKIGGFIVPKVEETKMLDEKRWALLQELKKNYNPKKWRPRKSPENISGLIDSGENLEQNQIQDDEEVSGGLSREFKRFWDEKIIQRFTIAVKPGIADFATKFYMRIKPKQLGHYTRLAEKLMHHPNVIELYRTGEDSGLLAIVRTKGLEGFRTFIKQFYIDFEILDTRTTVVLEEILPTVYPPNMEAAKEALSDSK